MTRPAASISLGVRRALQQCAQSDGTFAMLAMDQRGSLVRSLNLDDPDAVTFAEVAALKRSVIGALSPHASATLLDVEYGYPACVASGALSGRTGLLLAYEKSGYEGDPTARRTALLDNWDVSRSRRAGASGVKLLVYYRPDAANAADQEALVSDVAAECAKWELPLFLEPLHYSLDPARKSVPDAERREVVVETARRLTALGVTVLKAEFPVDVKQNDDETEWADRLRRVERSLARAVGAAQRRRRLRRLPAPGQSRLRKGGQRRAVRPRRLEGVDPTGGRGSRRLPARHSDRPLPGDRCHGKRTCAALHGLLPRRPPATTWKAGSSPDRTSPPRAPLQATKSSHRMTHPKAGLPLVGIDVGGTFTDFVLLSGGELYRPQSPHDARRPEPRHRRRPGTHGRRRGGRGARHDRGHQCPAGTARGQDRAADHRRLRRRADHRPPESPAALPFQPATASSRWWPTRGDWRRRNGSTWTAPC